MKDDTRVGRFRTGSGIEVDSVYEADAGDAEGLERPGQFPFTRGIYPDMYRGRLWTMRQYAGFGTAEETNQRYHYLLTQGTTGLSVAFDLPTQMGYDSDHPIARGEVGRVGVAIDTIEDMRTLFDGIALDQVSTSMTINSTAAILLALYLSVGDEQGVGRKRTGRHDPERRAQGVHRSRYLHLSSGPQSQAGYGPGGFSAPGRYRGGIRSRSRVITSVRPAPPRHRRSRSRWPTDSNTWRVCWLRESPWRTSRRGFPSSSRRTMISLKKSPNSGLRAACGPGS